LYEGASLFKPRITCISFSSLKVKPHFIVGKCRECLNVTENWNPNMDEPTRQVDPGENPIIMNPGTISAVDISILAVEWWWKVQEHERGTPIDQDREERAHETRRKLRRMRWDADWADYRSTHRGEVLPKILDLTDETRGDEALLGNTVFELEQRFRMCRGEGLDKSFVCTPIPESVKIHGHGKCFVQALIRKRACLQCRRPVKFALKSSFDDPKSRWDEGKKKWIQVDGYVDFKTGLDGRDFFEPYGKEDRWGDKTQERADTYRLAQSLSPLRAYYLNRIAGSEGGSR
jgi:hypothetical protein